ncbi:FtsK/SpoIIIE family DNA translocase [Candidatus Pelagibacter communis]|uniref:FtsK/SpoIIIE family DNA translocase n=1 Tax=Pelagibacter ubique TaxID=198252 RepID=UPI00094C3DA7
MQIKNGFEKIKDFAIKKFIEFIGILTLIFAFLILLSLISYNPNDPNFIYPENQEIKNFLGIYGSIGSDFLLQSIGLIAYFLPITLIFLSLTLIFQKTLISILNSFFYIVCYSIVGTIFLTQFYKEAFFLVINGNGGFVGNYFYNNIFFKITDINTEVSYYFLIILFVILFIISINFKLEWFSILGSIIKRKKTFSPIKAKEYVKDEFMISGDAQEKFSFEKKNDTSGKQITSYKLPNINLLEKPTIKNKKNTLRNDINEEFLEKILLDFGVEGKIRKISSGPVVTLNEFEPAAGVKVSKIVNLSDDIARNTSSESARISVIPGSSSVGIELPNLVRDNVSLREILNSSKFSNKDIILPIALGKSISGQPIISDLSSMPHLLIAGTTGSGKSVCINTILISLLYRHKPELCKFILIDPKMLELSTYEGIPHLLCPVITEAKKAATVLGWVVKEMENRYKLMTKVGVRNIGGYNSKHKLPMPYIVVVVDEMSDLMLVAGKEIENYIQKLSQMARAAGIHIIMATQRPSVDVITGTIKANFPTRVSFQVSSKIDSRTILGEQGAEQLLGKGDMLYMSSANRITRIHAPFVSENEIEKINNFLRSQGEPEYVEEILNLSDEKENNLDSDKNNEQIDDLYETALEIVKSERKASTSFLQRKLQIGYNRAARIIDMMEEKGIVSKANHVGKREVL